METCLTGFETVADGIGLKDNPLLLLVFLEFVDNIAEIKGCHQMIPDGSPRIQHINLVLLQYLAVQVHFIVPDVPQKIHVCRSHMNNP